MLFVAAAGIEPASVGASGKGTDLRHRVWQRQHPAAR